MGRLKLVWFLLVLHTAEAAEINHASVMYKQGVYRIEVDVAINAEIKKVRIIIDDYDRLDRLSTAIIDSTLIDNPEAELIRHRITGKTCILFFCFKAIVVGDIQEIDHYTMMTAIPEQSDFKSATAEWHVTPIGGDRTRIEFNCEGEPNFWIPPLIGPIVIKHKLLQEVKLMIQQIEILATNG